MIQKAAALGNWWLAASSRQCTCSCIMFPAEFFGRTSNHPGDSVPRKPSFGALQLLGFPKMNIIFEREEISDCWWDSGKSHGQLRETGGHCVRSQGVYCEGDWGVIVLCTTFLVSSSINVSIFHNTWLDTFWTDLMYHTRMPPRCPFNCFKSLRPMCSAWCIGVLSKTKILAVKDLASQPPLWDFISCLDHCHLPHHLQALIT